MEVFNRHDIEKKIVNKLEFNAITTKTNRYFIRYTLKIVKPIIAALGFYNPCDDNYNSYIDILSEKILENVLKTFKPTRYSNVAEPIESNSIRRKITFIIE